jgi:hypothetical protein
MTDNIRKDLRKVVAQMEALAVRRDELIRQGVAAKIPVVDLAADANLKPARIYQIRDGRR